MPTATTHIAQVGGFAGPARCFRLSEPHRFEGGVESSYVTVWAQPAMAHMAAEVKLVPATETGACSQRYVQHRAGSFTLHETPDGDEYLDGCYWLALRMLGYDWQAAS